jgi:hypothetical protein
MKGRAEESPAYVTLRQLLEEGDSCLGTADLSLLEHSITSCYRNSQLTHDLRYANDCPKSIALRKVQRNDHCVAGIDV